MTTPHALLAWLVIGTLHVQVRQDEVTASATQEAGFVAAARGKDGLSVGSEELDRVLLQRFGGAEDGRALLDLLVRARLLEALAREVGLEISGEELARRWNEMDRAIRLQGDPDGLHSEIRRRRLSVEEFRDFLRLSVIQEELTRRALELDPGSAVSGEEQEVWLLQEMNTRGLEIPAPPWSEGIAARCGQLSVGIDAFAAFLRRRLAPEDVRDTCWHLLLVKGLERRLPDLAPEARAAGIDVEIARRRAKHAGEYPGISFEQRLGAAGRNLELLRHDPSVQIATLSRIWVDRTYGEDGLRGTYEKERAFFEGRFGRSVRTHMIFLVAGRFVNDLNSRTFEQAEEELLELRKHIGNLDDFEALAAEVSEEPMTRKVRGEIGWVRSADTRAPEPLRGAVFEYLDTGGRIPAEGCAVGPVRTDGGCALLWLSGLRPSPDWEAMKEVVHAELRRRLVEDAMPIDSVEVLVGEPK